MIASPASRLPIFAAMELGASTYLLTNYFAYGKR